ncbi:MAG: ankyrin repeat domain-containing protein [Gammaproteobacteria bacterium]|nr:ankyrin repeat domain-containing protein [Gammaproteobacteria bacterium]
MLRSFTTLIGGLLTIDSLHSYYTRGTFIPSFFINTMLYWLTPSIPYGQQWVLERMQTLGYKVSKLNFLTYEKDPHGHCGGFAEMAAQAFLCDDIETFNQRLRTIADIPISDYTDDFAGLREKKKRLLDEGKLDEAKQIERTIYDILAFFDGVVIGQNSAEFSLKALYPLNETPELQDFTQTMSLTLPVDLDPHTSETQHKTPTHVETLVGSYNQEEFLFYLQCLQNNLSENTALNLSCNKHAINLNFDTEKGAWLLINANDLPGAYYKSTTAVAEKLFDGFTFRNGPNPREIGGIVLETSIFTQAQHAYTVHNNLQGMKQDAQFQTLHDGSRWYLEYGEYSPLHYALDTSNEAWILKALKATPKLDINQSIYPKENEHLSSRPFFRDEDKGSPLLSYTISIQNVGMTRILLKEGARATQKMINTAADNGNPLIVALFIEHGVPPTEKALKAAARSGSKATVELLIQHGIMPTEETLEEAARAGQAKIVELLLTQYHIQPTEKTLENQKNENIIQLILDNGAIPTESMLEQACGYPQQKEVITFCLKHQIKPTPRSMENSVIPKNIETIEQLMAHGGQLNESMLQSACSFQQDEIASFLINHNIKPTVTMLKEAIEHFDRTCEHLSFKLSIERIPQESYIIALLMDNGIELTDTMLETMKNLDAKNMLQTIQQKTEGTFREAFDTLRTEQQAMLEESELDKAYQDAMNKQEKPPNEDDTKEEGTSLPHP